MNWIDTHAHIYADELKNILPDVLRRAEENNMIIYMPNIDDTSIEPMLSLAEKNTFCIPMMGLHPCYVQGEIQHKMYQIEKHLFSRQYAAVGEIGIDLYWDKSSYEIQKEVFLTQCQWALDLQLPIVIHSREAISETIGLVKPFAKKGLKGIFHCFTGNIPQAQEIIEMGFLLGIGGVITYKNSNLGEVLSLIDLQHIVLETDSPYLPPVPHRGKANEPVYLNYVAQKLSEIKKMSLEDISTATTQQAKAIFAL